MNFCERLNIISSLISKSVTLDARWHKLAEIKLKRHSCSLQRQLGCLPYPDKIWKPKVYPHSAFPDFASASSCKDAEVLDSSNSSNCNHTRVKPMLVQLNETEEGHHIPTQLKHFPLPELANNKNTANTHTHTHKTHSTTSISK